MIGGKKIAEGGYGCVFYPEINCDGKEEKNKKKQKHISKLQFLDFSSKNEINTGLYLKKFFSKDKDQPLLNNFAPVVSSCNIDISQLKKDFINDCGILQKYTTEKNVSIIKVRYIDMNVFDTYLLENIDIKSVILTLISSYNHLLDSLKKLLSAKVVHFDLKGPNIVFDKKLNIPIIIDFGLSFKLQIFDLLESTEIEKLSNEELNNILEEDNLFNYFYVYAPQYYIWPIEVHYLNYLIHRNDKPTEEELKKIAKDFTMSNSALIGFSDSFKLKYEKLCFKVLQNYENPRNYNLNKNDSNYERNILMNKKLAVLKSWKTWDNYSISIMIMKILNAFIKTDSFYDNNFYQKYNELLLNNIHPNFNKRFSVLDTIDKFKIIIKNQNNNIETFSNFEAGEQVEDEIKKLLTKSRDEDINKYIKKISYI